MNPETMTDHELKVAAMHRDPRYRDDVRAFALANLSPADRELWTYWDAEHDLPAGRRR